MCVLGMKIPRLAVLLPIAHFVIASVLIGSEDSKYSRLELEAIDRRDRIERWEKMHPETTIQSKAASEREAAFEESIAMEYRPASTVKSIYGVDLPAAAILGWFWHPITAYFGGSLQPLLHKIYSRHPGNPEGSASGLVSDLRDLCPMVVRGTLVG